MHKNFHGFWMYILGVKNHQKPRFVQFSFWKILLSAGLSAMHLKIKAYDLSLSCIFVIYMLWPFIWYVTCYVLTKIIFQCTECNWCNCSRMPFVRTLTLLLFDRRCLSPEKGCPRTIKIHLFAPANYLTIVIDLIVYILKCHLLCDLSIYIFVINRLQPPEISLG